MCTTGDFGFLYLNLATAQVISYQGAQGGSGKRIGVILRLSVCQFSVSFHEISLPPERSSGEFRTHRMKMRKERRGRDVPKGKLSS
jgi:hypothetical protein